MGFIKNLISKTKASGANGEMTFVDHIEELRWHIIRSLIVILIAAIVVFINIEWIFDRVILGPAHPDFVAYKWFCSLGALLHIDALCLDDVKMQFQNTALAGQFVMSLSSSLMIGFIIAFPYILWEVWRFIKPALKSNERRYAKSFVFWGSLLFFIGLFFSYFIIAPYTINFFGSYQLSPTFQNIITMENYYETMSDLIMGMGIVFELPIIVYFLSRIGIVTPELMQSKRRYAILILLILAEVITPPDWFSCFLVFIPLYILYELSIVISRRAVKERKRKQALKDLQ